MSDIQRGAYGGVATGRDSYSDGTLAPNRPEQLMGESRATIRDPNYNKMKPIQINQVDQGFVVTVGCQTLAIETKQQLISKFIEYVNAPAQTEAKHLEGKLF
jgi:hypothetical protein